MVGQTNPEGIVQGSDPLTKERSIITFTFLPFGKLAYGNHAIPEITDKVNTAAPLTTYCAIEISNRKLKIATLSRNFS